jgi:tetratricopeptide (TPR) repeat protein
MPPPARISADDRLESTLLELRRRIERHPEGAIHWKGYLSILIRHGKWTEARRVAEDFAGTGLDPWWAAQARAVIEVRSGKVWGAQEELARMAGRSPGFIPYFFVASFHRQVGRFEDALSWFDRAAEHPLSEIAEESYVPEFYAWDAATFAYDRESFGLAVKICDRWEEHHESTGGAERSFLAVRAAARLALGEVEEALADAEAAVRASERQTLWAEDLEKLLRAARAGNRAYRWMGDGSPEPYQLLISYR